MQHFLNGASATRRQSTHLDASAFRQFAAAALLCVCAYALLPNCYLVAQQDQVQSADPGVLKGSEYRYRGYRFDLKSLSDQAERQAMLQALRQQTDIVEGTALTEPTKQFLRSFTVHVSEGEGEHSGNGHFSREGVFVSLRSKPDDRPILLHEFMHAFHNDRLPEGRQNPQVLLFFNRAKQGGRWPAGSYMLSNVGEFFAMTASTYLNGHTARPPFTREAIEHKQPLYAEWLSNNVR